MTKISTDDCKKFIAEFEKRNDIESIRYRVDSAEEWKKEGNQKIVDDSKNPKKWKRLFKQRIDEDEEYNYYVDGAPINHYADEHKKINSADIEWVRGFELSGTEMEVAYLVYELKDGTLLLGNYIGD